MKTPQERVGHIITTRRHGKAKVLSYDEKTGVYMLELLARRGFGQQGGVIYLKLNFGPK